MGLTERVQGLAASQKDAPDAALLATSIDQLLADYAAEPAPSPELTYAVIGLLRGARRYAEALTLMQQRRPAIDAKSGEIAFHELELHFRCGEREAGGRLLEAFLASGRKMRPSWKRFIDRVQAEPAPPPRRPARRSRPAQPISTSRPRPVRRPPPSATCCCAACAARASPCPHAGSRASRTPPRSWTARSG